jgi:hypothetical protein
MLLRFLKRINPPRHDISAASPASGYSGAGKPFGITVRFAVVLSPGGLLAFGLSLCTLKE